MEAPPVAGADGAPHHGLGGMREAVKAVGGGGEEIHQHGIGGEHQLALTRAYCGESQEGRLEHQAAQEQVAIDREQAAEPAQHQNRRPTRPPAAGTPVDAYDHKTEAQARVLGEHALMPLVRSIRSSGRRES
jgi:hypothetical protein